MTLPEQVGALKRAVHRAVMKKLAGETKRPLLQLSALYTIARGEVETQNDLAQRLLIDAPAASRLVDRLEQDGLLRRAPGSDRRSVRLRVTPAARPHIATLEAALSWLDSEVKRHLSAQEINAAMRAMQKLQKGLLDQSS
jgi:MarR family transcriptional regulator, transcriptional regulator for hemolysin